MFIVGGSRVKNTVCNNSCKNQIEWMCRTSTSDDKNFTRGINPSCQFISCCESGPECSFCRIVQRAICTQRSRQRLADKNNFAMFVANDIRQEG